VTHTWEIAQAKELGSALSAGIPEDQRRMAQFGILVRSLLTWEYIGCEWRISENQTQYDTLRFLK
jgi:hypothetical protein